MADAGDGAVVPLASACLNIADDHLEWHGSAEAYRAAKAKVYERTVMACVYNTTDEVTRTMVEGADVVEGCRAVGFTPGSPHPVTSGSSRTSSATARSGRTAGRAPSSSRPSRTSRKPGSRART